MMTWKALMKRLNGERRNRDGAFHVLPFAQKPQVEDCTAHKVMGWMSLPRVEATPLLSHTREERFSLVTRAIIL